ncbi:hypothetical protein [Streptomyces sp. NBC_01207]|uniref:hypothetical protein n=1 Tax=Streptomyces sp. NBC_01207 TaxID=2903772 RepID=UPI003FA365A4
MSSNNYAPNSTAPVLRWEDGPRHCTTFIRPPCSTNISLLHRVRVTKPPPQVPAGPRHRWWPHQLGSSAGLILAATFAALNVMPLLYLAQAGGTVATGGLLDALLVRLVLVPRGSASVLPLPRPAREDAGRAAARAARVRGAWILPTPGLIRSGDGQSA